MQNKVETVRKKEEIENFNRISLIRSWLKSARFNAWSVSSVSHHRVHCFALKWSTLANLRNSPISPFNFNALPPPAPLNQWNSMGYCGSLMSRSAKSLKIITYRVLKASSRGEYTLQVRYFYVSFEFFSCSKGKMMASLNRLKCWNA